MRNESKKANTDPALQAKANAALNELTKSGWSKLVLAGVNSDGNATCLFAEGMSIIEVIGLLEVVKTTALRTKVEDVSK